jgi:hypothetical protein
MKVFLKTLCLRDEGVWKLQITEELGKLLWIYLMKMLRRSVRNEHVEEEDNKEDNEET